MFYPDGVVMRNRGDEPNYHVPTIKKMATENILNAVKDYPSATFPLYHILISPIYKLWPDDINAMRTFNLLITLITVFLLFYYYKNCNPLLSNKDSSLFAFIIALTFVFSPFVRASALSITTDNLPYLFILIGLISLYYYDRYRRNYLIPIVVSASFLAFYTRQYYIWVPIYLFIEFIKLPATTRKSKQIYLFLSFLFTLPALYLVWVWNGFVPPYWQHKHETTQIFMMLPFIFSFIPFYLLPIYLMFIKKKYIPKIIKLILPNAILCCCFVLVYMKLSFNQTFIDGGGLCGKVLLIIFHQHAALLFLVCSYLGLASIILLITKFPRKNYIWIAALIVFIFSRIFWQKYFDPLVFFILFLTMPLSIREKLLKSKNIYYFPLMEIFIWAGTVLYY